MPALKRSISLRGPRFYLDGQTIMFVNHLDGSTQIGPRPASVADSEEHADAYAAFEADVTGRAEAAEPMAPLLTFADPPDGAPTPESGPYAKRRARAAEAAEA